MAIVFFDNTEELPAIEKIDGGHVSNTRALSKSATTYELEGFTKKLLIAFSLSTRSDIDIDIEALISTFGNLEFEILIFQVQTQDEIFEKCKLLSKINFTDYGCLGVVILNNGVSGMQNATNYNNIWNDINIHDNPTLTTKPRFLIIQTRQDNDHAPDVRSGQDWETAHSIEEDEPYTIPLDVDIMIIHGSYGGNPMLREDSLSFIQTFCTKVKQMSPRVDLDSILIEIKRELAFKNDYMHYNSDGIACSLENKKLIPVSSSTLIRKLYFKKYEEH